MKKLQRPFFYSWIFIFLTFYTTNFSKATDIESFSRKLEKTLNNRVKGNIEKLASKEIANDINKKYDDFLNNFPNAKWVIKPAANLKDKRKSIEIIVTGIRNNGSHKYSLISNQRLAISINDGKITKQEILSDYSILKSGKSNLDVDIAIPDIVLTGSIYDIDIIIKKPLKEPIIAASLISLNNRNKSNNIELIPTESGGLFKSVRAPFKPGIQRWGAFIAHPDGLISISKMVRVVATEKDIPH